MIGFTQSFGLLLDEIITNTTDSYIMFQRFWHLSIPTVGLHISKQPVYPYIPHFFSLWQLCPRKGNGVRAALLDTGVAASEKKSYAHSHLNLPLSTHLDSVRSIDFFSAPPHSQSSHAVHGTHCYGIINACTTTIPVGLAPDATLFMIKVCDNDGVSDSVKLIKGLKRAIQLGCQVVNIGIALDNPVNLDDKQIKKLITLLHKIPYIVAPSGNEALRCKKFPFIANTIAYPAGFEGIAFDVGAFGYTPDNEIMYPVCAFSQFQYNVGPKFLAPGFNILSTGFPTATCNNPYIFLHGTSMAAVLMTGFVILMLAEFGNQFSKEELLKVCYTSCIRLHNTKEWNEKSMLGTLDMRTALFILHVLKYIKDNLNAPEYSFESHFDNVLTGIHFILQAPVRYFSEKYLDTTSFTHNFAHFYTQGQKVQASESVCGFISKTVHEAVENSGKIILELIKKSPSLQVKNNHMTKKDQEKLITILFEKSDLFGSLNNECKNRIVKTFY